MANLAARTRHRPRTGAHGLTLIEMVVALGVVMVVLLAAGAAFFSIGYGQRSAESNDRAAQLATDQIETLHTIPWDQLGFYTADTGYRATCPTTACLTTTTETTVTLTGSRPTGSRAPQPLTTPSTSTYNNTFTVRTDVTWDADTFGGLSYASRVASDDHWTNTVGDPAKTGQPSPPDGIPDYDAKRITVTVTWKLGNATKSITNSTLRSPTLNEAIPASVGSTTADACDSNVYPFCRLWVTTGEVLNNPNGQPVVTSIVPVSFHAVTMSPVDTGKTVTASWQQTDGSTKTLTLTTSDGGRTWDTTAPAGTVLPLGPVTVTFNTVIGGQTKTRAYPDAAWRSAGRGGATDATADIVPITSSQATYTNQAWLPASLITDTAKAAGDTTPITGNEPQSNPAAFCIDSSGRLKNFQALEFDITNIDGQDDPNFKPTVTYTGTTLASIYGNNPTPPDGAGPNSTLTGQVNPVAVSAPIAAKPGSPFYLGAAAGGTVNAAPNPLPGALQRYRFAAGFPRGTVFSGVSTLITVSVVRPFDGVTVQRSISVPITTGC